MIIILFLPFLALNLNHDLNWIKIKSKIKNYVQVISISFLNEHFLLTAPPLDCFYCLLGSGPVHTPALTLNSAQFVQPENNVSQFLFAETGPGLHIR